MTEQTGDSPNPGDSSEAMAALGLSHLVQEDSERRMSGYLIDRVLDEMKAMPDPWQALSEDGQAMVLERLRGAVEHAVSHCVEHIATQGFPTWKGTVDSVTLKGGEAKVVLKGLNSPAVVPVGEGSGETAMLVLAPPDAYLAGLHDAQPDPAQGELDGLDQAAE